MSLIGLIALSRDSGVTCSNGSFQKHDLVQHILSAQSFASSLRAKHPGSFERSGDWWGFPGDYQVLDLEDLQREAIFSGVKLTYFKR